MSSAEHLLSVCHSRSLDMSISRPENVKFFRTVRVGAFGEGLSATFAAEGRNGKVALVRAEIRFLVELVADKRSCIFSWAASAVCSSIRGGRSNATSSVSVGAWRTRPGPNDLSRNCWAAQIAQPTRFEADLQIFPDERPTACFRGRGTAAFCARCLRRWVAATQLPILICSTRCCSIPIFFWRICHGSANVAGAEFPVAGPDVLFLASGGGHVVPLTCRIPPHVWSGRICMLCLPCQIQGAGNDFGADRGRSPLAFRCRLSAARSIRLIGAQTVHRLWRGRSRTHWHSGARGDVDGGVLSARVHHHVLNPKVAIFLCPFLPQFARPRVGHVVPDFSLGLYPNVIGTVWLRSGWRSFRARAQAFRRITRALPARLHGPARSIDTGGADRVPGTAPGLRETKHSSLDYAG